MTTFPIEKKRYRIETHLDPRIEYPPEILEAIKEKMDRELERKIMASVVTTYHGYQGWANSDASVIAQRAHDYYQNNTAQMVQWVQATGYRIGPRWVTTTGTCSTCIDTVGSYNTQPLWAGVTCETTAVGIYREYIAPYANPKTPTERMREMLQLRQSPAILVPSHRTPLSPPSDIREMRARCTLRTIIGEDSYRQFLRNGFVTVRGKSGRSYQVYPGHNFTRVFEAGKLVEELCVVLSGLYCPTDSILMRYVMLLNDENYFRSLANRYQPKSLPAMQLKPIDSRPLSEIFGAFKQKALLAA